MFLISAAETITPPYHLLYLPTGLNGGCGGSVSNVYNNCSTPEACSYICARHHTECMAFEFSEEAKSCLLYWFVTLELGVETETQLSKCYMKVENPV